jgi:para-nitrobenzyl esterase
VLKRPYTSTDSTLEKVASGYWVNFVRTGDPNGGSLPMWQAVKAGEHRTMELGAVIGPRPVTSGEKMRFWRAYLLAQSTAGR